MYAILYKLTEILHNQWTRSAYFPFGFKCWHQRVFPDTGTSMHMQETYWRIAGDKHKTFTYPLKTNTQETYIKFMDAALES